MMPALLSSVARYRGPLTSPRKLVTMSLPSLLTLLPQLLPQHRIPTLCINLSLPDHLPLLTRNCTKLATGPTQPLKIQL